MAKKVVEMDVEKVKELKMEVEKSIFAALRGFERDTGMSVTDVRLYKGCIEYGRDRKLVTDVTLVVEL